MHQQQCKAITESSKELACSVQERFTGIQVEKHEFAIAVNRNQEWLDQPLSFHAMIALGSVQTIRATIRRNRK